MLPITSSMKIFNRTVITPSKNGVLYKEVVVTCQYIFGLQRSLTDERKIEPTNKKNLTKRFAPYLKEIIDMSMELM